MVDIVIDANRCAEGESAVGAPREHYLRGALAIRQHTGQHVNIVVCRRPGTVYRDECLAAKSYAIDSALKKTAAQIYLRALIKRWCHAWVLRIAGANAPERAAEVGCTANKKVAVTSHVECPPYRSIRDVKRALPRGSPINRTAELATVASGSGAPGLILEPVSRTVGLIDREPFFIAAVRACVR